MNNIETIVVEINRVIYRDPDNGFSVLLTKILKGSNDQSIDRPIVVGKFLVANEGDNLEIEGRWGYDKQGRYQFSAISYQTIVPSTVKAITEYLMRTVSGIGRKKATDIVEAFGENTFNVIKSDYTKLAKVRGIGMKSAKNIYDEVVGNQEFERLALYLLPMGISHIDIVRIHDELGFSALNEIRANPYILISVDNISFATLDKIAIGVGLTATSEQRILAGVEDYIRESMNRRGNLFVFKSDVIEELEEHLRYKGQEIFGRDYSISNEYIDEMIELGIENDKFTIEKDIKNNDCLYISYYNYIENTIVDLVKKKQDQFIYSNYNKLELSTLIGNYEGYNGLSLASSQVDAIDMALSNNISIMSGGPGTGKTQTINAIINSLKLLNPNVTIELAAPTGKAAKRMSQMTAMPSKTIHRLIGLGVFGSDSSSETTVEADYLIVDEASMIDAYLFYKLLDSLSENTKLLIVGDHEQLPSVGPGLILRDLIFSGEIPTTRLTEVFRQAEGSKIILNSHKAVLGDKHLIEFDNGKDGEFYFIKRNHPNSIRAGIMQSVTNMMENKGYHLDDIQVLTMMNRGPLGAEILNREMQKRFNSNPIAIEVGSRHFKIGDRVMQTVNNYDIDVFNGDSGKIVSVDVQNKREDTTVVVGFDDRLVTYTGNMLGELVLAYAITVHKSQGSEFPVVIMPFHSVLSILTDKSMINTGWTRAEEIVVCIGDVDEMYKGVDKIDNTIRNSLIKEKLSA